MSVCVCICMRVFSLFLCLARTRELALARALSPPPSPPSSLSLSCALALSRSVSRYRSLARSLCVLLSLCWRVVVCVYFRAYERARECACSCLRLHPIPSLQAYGRSGFYGMHAEVVTCPHTSGSYPSIVKPGWLRTRRSGVDVQLLHNVRDWKVES